MHDMRDFQLSDMVRLDSALRATGRGAATMEQAAGRVVSHLADALVDKDSGEKACLLVRLFTTLPLGRLEPGLRERALAAVPAGAVDPAQVDAVRCLTLLGTTGDEPEWRSRGESRAHQVIPLPSERAVAGSPMIAELVRQLGVDVAALAGGSPGRLMLGHSPGAMDVFLVDEADGSPYVPAQDFVHRYGVRSVLGFGGILPDGELYAVICFSRTPVSRETAERFTTVASSVGLVLLAHVGGRVFDSDPERDVAPDPTREAWRARATSDLLAVHEASVLEQSLLLEEAVSNLADRAIELDQARRNVSRSEALKSAMLASALDAVVSIDAHGVVIEWNSSAEQTFGHTRDAALGQPMADLLIPQRHREAHRRGLARHLRTGEETIIGRRVEIEALHADGHEVPVELTVARPQVDGPPVFTAFLRDVTEARRATAQRRELLASERTAREAAEQAALQVRRLYELGSALGDAETPADVARIVVAGVQRQIGASTGALWLLNEAGDQLRVVHAVGSSIGLLDHSPMPLDSSLPIATALSRDEPVWVGSRSAALERHPGWPARGDAASFAILPLTAEGARLGSLVVGFATDRDFPESDRTFLLSVAGLCAQALQRAVLRDREASAAAGLAFLAEAGRTLGTSLDHRLTLQQVTELSLPLLGQMCVVHLLDPASRQLRQVASAHQDPEVAEQLAALVDYRPPPGSPLDQVLRTGRTVVLPGLSDDELRAATTTEQEYAVARALGLGPSVSVPLVARSAVIGTVTLGRARDLPPYDPDAVALVEALAERAAAAIDNSRAHAASTEVALTLQRSLMPLDLATPPWLELGFRYQPGSLDTEVGGDWFDVIPVGLGRTGLVIGDVMGRGIRAAAVMGQLRAAVRAYAALDLEPDRLVTELDRLVLGLGDAALVTCVYAVLDAPTGQVTWCNAGHLPPVVVSADGGVRTIELPTGAPLGVGGVRFETASSHLAPGDVVVLYTDGLVESRRRDVHSGIVELTEQLGRPSADLDGLCGAALEAMVGPAGHDDDAAVLAVGLRGEGGRLQAWELTVTHGAAEVSRVRTEVAATLAAWGLESVGSACLQLVGELLANALRHGRDRVRLRLGQVDRTLRVEVHDDGPDLPRLQSPGPEHEAGRGLVLVDALARTWGVVHSRGTGKTVWFELSVDIDL